MIGRDKANLCDKNAVGFALRVDERNEGTRASGKLLSDRQLNVLHLRKSLEQSAVRIIHFLVASS